MTAAALAGELHLPLFTVLLEGLITKFMGETAAKLRLVFDAMTTARGVYFFDEFDAIGARRSERNDVGEIRRVLNSFLQFLEKDESDSLIIAATNHPELLDSALYRRFDDVIRYDLPDSQIARRILETRLSIFSTSGIDWLAAVKAGEGMSQAELARSAAEAAKRAILEDRETVTNDDLAGAIAERKAAALS
jgi:SpoVK/Ycf46/Vps4 family AAA+-type ATPase